jgi:hypothetical protein
MKTFEQYLLEQNVTEMDMKIIQESLISEWTPELEYKVDLAIEEFVSGYKNPDGSYNIDRFNDELTNEGLLGSIVGGLTGFALGTTIGRTICKVLGIQSGILYDMFTSRLVSAALGAALGKRI